MLGVFLEVILCKATILEAEKLLMCVLAEILAMFLGMGGFGRHFKKCWPQDWVNPK